MISLWLGAMLMASCDQPVVPPDRPVLASRELSFPEGFPDAWRNILLAQLDDATSVRWQNDVFPRVTLRFEPQDDGFWAELTISRGEGLEDSDRFALFEQDDLFAVLRAIRDSLVVRRVMLTAAPELEAALVESDCQALGRLPLSNVDLSLGTHTATLYPPGGGLHQVTFTVEPDSEVIQLEPGPIDRRELALISTVTLNPVAVSVLEPGLVFPSLSTDLHLALGLTENLSLPIGISVWTGRSQPDASLAFADGQQPYRLDQTVLAVQVLTGVNLSLVSDTLDFFVKLSAGIAAIWQADPTAESAALTFAAKTGILWRVNRNVGFELGVEGLWLAPHEIERPTRLNLTGGFISASVIQQILFLGGFVSLRLQL